MKTTIRLHSCLTLILAVCAICAVGLSPLVATAELSDRELEVSIRERKRDFDRFVIQRKASFDKAAAAAQSLREARRADQARQLETERNYRATMKRYSMEEVETRDRADEARLAKESKENDLARSGFVVNRNRRRVLEASIAPVDPYEEYEIDMKVEPDSKVSHPGATDANP